MWINLLENEKALKAIYEISRSLDRIFLHEIMINNHGPSLEIRLDLKMDWWSGILFNNQVF